jgi:hypothetical protein
MSSFCIYISMKDSPFAAARDHTGQWEWHAVFWALRGQIASNDGTLLSFTQRKRNAIDNVWCIALASRTRFVSLCALLHVDSVIRYLTVLKEGSVLKLPSKSMTHVRVHVSLPLRCSPMVKHGFRTNTVLFKPDRTITLVISAKNKVVEVRNFRVV